jgi:D-3-phosphoglycerate dehydrogenase
MNRKSLKECKILVTPTSFAKHDPALRKRLESEVGEVIYNTTGRPMTSADLVPLIPGVDGFIAGLDEIRRSVIEAADCLKVIARYGVGVDAIDLQAAREKGIVVTNTPGANSISVAELTIGLILALARDIPAAARATSAGQWPRMSGISLARKVIGLIGFGSIGKHVARRLRSFDCILLAYDPIITELEASKMGVQLLPSNEVIRQADFLSLHCPLTEETRRMVNADFIARMKDGAYLINTARGELVDELALVEALQRGKLRGAALDVFTQQPPDVGHPLLAMPQVIATPHMAAHTDGATNAMGWGALEDCLAVLRGSEPAHRVV